MGLGNQTRQLPLRFTDRQRLHECDISHGGRIGKRPVLLASPSKKLFFTLDSGCPGSPAKLVLDECRNDICGSPPDRNSGTVSPCPRWPYLPAGLQPDLEVSRTFSRPHAASGQFLRRRQQ